MESGTASPESALAKMTGECLTRQRVVSSAARVAASDGFLATKKLLEASLSVFFPEVTAKFKCVVRIIDVYPWRVEDFHSPVGTCRIKLTLEDPTARIHAFVYAEDGIHFIGASQSTDVLTRKRNLLLGISGSGDSNESKNAPRDAPWVQCCIKSYYLNVDDIWGSRRYQIFGTRLVNEL